MGFWHTGYIEHHEFNGLGTDWQPTPPSYRCDGCDAVFDSAELLHRHRFEAHPTTQPALFIRNVRIGNSPVRITCPLREEEIEIAACESGTFNGSPIELRDIPMRLATVANDRIQLVLTNDRISAAFDIDVRIASDADLDVVDASFRGLAERRNLDRRAVDGFLRNCRHCDTATSYRGGIAEYLYGVLAMERRGDIRIPFEQYPDRFNEAAERLADYNRPLTRLIRSLIAFHFNHFREAASVSPSIAIRNAAAWFDAALHERELDHQPAQHATNDPVDLLADDETRFILRLAGTSAQVLKRNRPEIEQRLQARCSSFARLKLNVLLLEACRSAGDLQGTMQTARLLLNFAESEPLAEHILKSAPSAPNREDNNLGPR